MKIVNAIFLHCHFVLLVLRLTLLYKDIITKNVCAENCAENICVTINREQIYWRLDYSAKQDLKYLLFP